MKITSVTIIEIKTGKKEEKTDSIMKYRQYYLKFQQLQSEFFLRKKFLMNTLDAPNENLEHKSFGLDLGATYWTSLV